MMGNSGNLVSVVVPVYNAEFFLENSIQSIINQTYKNIEIILINDGSMDNSSVICNQYATKDSRIKVIHQENSGPSKSRNNGIDLAQGEYILFVDSDDTLDCSMIEKLVEAIKKDGSQLVLCGYNSIGKSRNNRQKKGYPKFQELLTIKEFLIKFGTYYKKSLINQVWNKLFITDLIKKENIRFVENLNMGEDLLFILEYLKVCRKISIIKDPLYNYFISNNNSLTGNYKNSFYSNQQMLFNRVRDFLINNNAFNEQNKYIIEKAYIDSIIGCFANLFHRNAKLNSKEIKFQIMDIISDPFIIENYNYFTEGNLQHRIISRFIKFKSVNGIIYFFKFKRFLSSNMYPLFLFLKDFDFKMRGRAK